jgi:hypothetical protein
MDTKRTPPGRLSRRQFNRLAVGATAAFSASGWLEALADQTPAAAERGRSCILLWMTGGASQLDTFDPKPGHANAGPVKAISTSVPGIVISEYLPKLSKHARHAAIIRSMSTKEGDHTRATYHVHTGYRRQPPIEYPTFGSTVSKELGKPEADLPSFVSVSPYKPFSPSAFGPGFLGPKYAPLLVGDGASNRNEYQSKSLGVRDLALPQGIRPEQAAARAALLERMDDEFAAARPDAAVRSRRAAYEAAGRMMGSSSANAFDLEEEPDALREAYGRNRFGQACLLARRLVERGVSFVEVSFNGVAGEQSFAWDTHQGNFRDVPRLCEVLDSAWAALLEDLESRGLLSSTLVAWAGEFGRTPQINRNAGRDHYPVAWSTVLCGAGVRGGTVYGATSEDGMRVTDRPVGVAQLLATVYQALGVDSQRRNISNVGRPIRIVEPDAAPIAELLS